MEKLLFLSLSLDIQIHVHPQTMAQPLITWSYPSQIFWGDCSMNNSKTLLLCRHLVCSEVASPKNFDCFRHWSWFSFKSAGLICSLKLFIENYQTSDGCFRAQYFQPLLRPNNQDKLKMRQSAILFFNFSITKFIIFQLHRDEFFQ